MFFSIVRIRVGVEKALKESQLLFDSLMQQCLGDLMNKI